jgi:hypothetical protein
MEIRGADIRYRLQIMIGTDEQKLEGTYLSILIILELDITERL